MTKTFNIGKNTKVNIMIFRNRSVDFHFNNFPWRMTLLLKLPGIFIHIVHQKNYTFKTVSIEELKEMLKSRRHNVYNK